MPVYTFKLVFNLQGLVISVHMSFMQLNNIEFVTSLLLWLIQWS